MARPPNSWVWQHFRHVSNEQSHSNVQCLICDKTFRYSSRNGPTNLARHISKSHNIGQPESNITRRPFESSTSKIHSETSNNAADKLLGSGIGVDDDSHSPSSSLHTDHRPASRSSHTDNEENSLLDPTLKVRSQQQQQQQQQQKQPLSQQPQSQHPNLLASNASANSNSPSTLPHLSQHQPQLATQISRNTQPAANVLDLASSNGLSPPSFSSAAPMLNHYSNGIIINNDVGKSTRTDYSNDNINRNVNMLPLYRLDMNGSSNNNNTNGNNNGTLQQQKKQQSQSQQQQQQQQLADHSPNLQQNQRNFVKNNQSKNLSSTVNALSSIQKQIDQFDSQLFSTQQQFLIPLQESANPSTNKIQSHKRTHSQTQSESANINNNIINSLSHSHDQISQLNMMFQGLHQAQQTLQQELKKQQKSIVRIEQRLARSINSARGSGIDEQFELLPFANGSDPANDEQGLPLLYNVFTIFACSNMTLDQLLNNYELSVVGISNLANSTRIRQEKIFKLAKFIGCFDVEKYWDVYAQRNH